MKFIGIDLGWISGASGLCCLQWTDQRLHLLDLCCKRQITEILAWLDNWVMPHAGAMIAVDAPTIISNQTGMRLPDRLTHRYFGRYHAGCYPANLNRPFAKRTLGFGQCLSDRGFCHAATITPQQFGRYQIEVFPHPAMVKLFNLDRILKYKKGNLSQKKAGIKNLQDYINQQLTTLTPALSLDCQIAKAVINAKLDDYSGRETKMIEDELDSLICAYVGAYWWYWGNQRNWVLGDEKQGYIIVPNPAGTPMPTD